MSQFHQFLSQFGIKDVNHPSFLLSFTHASFVVGGKKKGDLERLELLGDSVVQLIVTSYIFNLFPDLSQGDLTRIRAELVRESALANFCAQLGLNQHLRMGLGELQTGGQNKPSIMADLCESFLGAVYVVEGYQLAKDILLPLVKEAVQHLDHHNVIDFKSRLQELLQLNPKVSIRYVTDSVEGPSNAPLFQVSVIVNEIVLGTGSGTTKKRASQEAAKAALERMVSHGDI